MIPRRSQPHIRVPRRRACAGNSRRCFSADRERFGPADYKIWHTSQISAKSVGRGWSLPVGLIPVPIVQQLSELTQKLGYLPVDDKWGTAEVPADLRITGDRSRPGGADIAAVQAAADAFGSRLHAGVERIDSGFAQRWEACAKEAFMIVATPPAAIGGGPVSRWRIDLAARTVTAATPADGEDSTAWDIVGSAGAWQGLLDGAVNLGVAMRRCDLRYCDTGEGGPMLANVRLDMLADLLGIASTWEVTLPMTELAAVAAGD